MPATLAATAIKTLPDVSVGHSLIQMVVALVVIIACIWGLGKVLTRMRSGGSTPKRRAAPGGLSVVSRQTLGKDLAIATVRWGEREILVGIAGSTITFLDNARPEPAFPAAMQAPAFPAAMQAPAFPAAMQAPAFPAAMHQPAVAMQLGGLAMPADGVVAAPTAVPAAVSGRTASLLDSLRDATLRR